MIGKKFTAQPSGKEYLIIEKHKVFNDVYRCIPTYKVVTPYKANLIQCFADDFIQECLNQQDNGNTEITNWESCWAFWAH